MMLAGDVLSMGQPRTVALKQDRETTTNHTQLMDTCNNIQRLTFACLPFLLAGGAVLAAQA